MTRRELLVAMLQAFFLALFPWLRTDDGVRVLGEALDKAVTERAIFKVGEFRIEFGIRGYEVSEAFWRACPSMVGWKVADEPVTFEEVA